MPPQSSVAQFAASLARQAGGLLMDRYRAGDFDPSLKADRSVVTLADVASDRLISAAIQAAYPDDLLLSEELSPNLSQFTETQRAVWIIDPLDGTSNFSLGFPFWGVLLARIVDGAPQTSVMYFPMLDELYVAQRGQGATLNDRPLVVRPPSELNPLSFFACCSRTHRRYRVGLRFKTRIVGSTAYTLCTVARSIAVVGFEATPKIWDLAAPWLLVQEAGGLVETYDRQPPFPLQAGVDYARQSFPLLAAANPHMLQLAREAIQPIV